jgi:hypothetical protein
MPRQFAARVVGSLVCLAVAGCAGPAPLAPVSPPVEVAPAPVVPTPVVPAPDAAPLRGVDLFPARDLVIPFILYEAGPENNPIRLDEALVRDGDRVVSGYADAPYATWLLTDDGVWRADPGGGGALLRFLPAVLADGMAWKQRSGDAEVWFDLDSNRDNCDRMGTDRPFYGEPCWTLTVLNRGVRTVFTFARGYGPVWVEAVNWARPQDSFRKEAGPKVSDFMVPDRRSAYLTQSVQGPPPKEPVVEVPAGAFEAAAATGLLRSRPGATAADFDGDGQDDYVAGPLGAWIEEPVQFYRGDGALLNTVERWAEGGRHRVTLVRLDGDKRAWFLTEQEMGPDRHLWVRLMQANGAEVWGWAPKASRTEATAVSVEPDGRFTLTWQLDDPARHTWIRSYQIDLAQQDWPYLSMTSSEFVASEQELRYPSDPAGVLQAAFLAFWYDLGAELPRYFASPSVLEALTGDPALRKAMYGPGTVEIGTVTLKEDKGFGDRSILIPEVRPGPVGPDGSIGFVARLSLYENTHYVWGKVTFGTDPAGRPVIVGLVIEGAQDVFC